MSKIIAIMQPTYMPWLGYFSMIDQVQEFVFLDNVQLVTRSWQVRNKIKFQNQEKLLTIPVNKDKSRDERFIYNTSYSGVEWKENHLDTIKCAYSKTPYFTEVFSFLEGMYFSDYVSIGEMNENFITSISKRIGIITPFFYSNDMDVEGHKDLLLVNICKKRNADVYLSAQGSAEYIEAESPAGFFGKTGIELYYLNYEHPLYSQIGECFIPYIGIYDLLFNVGFDSALEVIRSGKRENISSKIFRKEYLKIS